MSEPTPEFVSGFVSILGRPNSGKSTLVNALVGAKVAIVSSKPQTTRTAVQAVLTTLAAQVVFLDTPGVHEPKSLLNRRMMDAVREALADRDLLIWMADAARGADPADLEALRILDGNPAPAFLVLNKIDLVRDKQQLLPLIEAYRAQPRFEEFFPVSARSGDGLDELTKAIIARMPPGPRYFPPDYLTDQPERYLAAELIRERVLWHARDEVPHAVAVAIERWEERGRLLRIAAVVYVERPGQKKIIIGAGGEKLKQIGTEAREQMESLLMRRIYLEVFVKVQPGWRESPQFLNEIDWRQMAGGDPQ